jgi:hypothetical protein
MRFRLGTNLTAGGDSTGGLAGGISKAIGNYAMLPLLQAQAAEQGQQEQAKAGLMASQQKLADTHAAVFGAQADAAQRANTMASLPEQIKTAYLMSGGPLHQAGEAADYFQTGKLPGQYVQPPEDLGGGPALPAPAYADPSGLGGQIMQKLGLLRGADTVGGKIDDVVKAAGGLQKQDAVRASVANPAMAALYGRGFAASEGKPLIENIGNTGRGFDQFSGEGTTLSPGLAALYDKGEQAQIGQRNAAASASYASARHSDAGTRKINQDIDQGARTGNLQVVTGPNGEITVVDKRNLTAQPVLGADGKPVIKGAAKILDDLAAEGVYFPGQVKGTAEGVAGAVPIIGDSLREGAGSLMNRAPTYLGGPNEKQQRVEQAQRDFINAVLRRESGAAISASEFENARKQYFPQPGDEKHPKVLEQKRRARQIATNLMLQEVPEAQRYKLGSGYTPTATTAPASPVTPEGSWAAPAPAGRNVQVSY